MDNTTAPAAANLKVFVTRALSRDDWPTEERQPEVIVAAKSRAAAVRAFQQVIGSMTDNHLKTYGSVTSNPAQIEAALSEPGTVFVGTHSYAASDRDYAPLRPAK